MHLFLLLPARQLTASTLSYATPMIYYRRAEDLDLMAMVMAYQNVTRGRWRHSPHIIADGGINGVYYNPDADGHYITIIDNPYNTLVMWNSFDKDGNQYFVHGTGELVAGRSLVADAYINVSGSTSPEGEIVPAQELHWGTLEVEMTSCNEGILAFNSDFPEVGSGQVRLQRVVFVKQLGCVD